MRKTLFTLIVFCLSLSFASAQELPANDEVARQKSFAKFEKFMASEEWPVPEELTEGQACEGLKLTINGQMRKVMIIYPESARSGKAAPVVFVFHGRRGLLPRVMKSMNIYKYFPEAITVYPQGLWIDTPNAKKMQWGTGWKVPRKGGDWRDIHLFDALLDTLGKSFTIDSTKIYAMGHSNGGGMTYGLWSLRGDKLAAVSVSCAGSKLSGPLADMRAPKPVFFVIATQDQLVDYNSYKEYIDFIVSKQTICKALEIAPGKLFFPAKEGNADVVVDTIEDSHKVDKAAMPLIADFFRKH